MTAIYTVLCFYTKMSAARNVFSDTSNSILSVTFNVELRDLYKLSDKSCHITGIMIFS